MQKDKTNIVIEDLTYLELAKYRIRSFITQVIAFLDVRIFPSDMEKLDLVVFLA